MRQPAHRPRAVARRLCSRRVWRFSRAGFVTRLLALLLVGLPPRATGVGFRGFVKTAIGQGDAFALQIHFHDLHFDDIQGLSPLCCGSSQTYPDSEEICTSRLL
ncbi:hypothetical protein CW304_32955 [Bacillus sp. UFRGS-B20]|nr:hypothetical protein CW304_32955 [Bacillus sp. UFRGS-B20]